MPQTVEQPTDRGFNLTIDEVKIITKLRQLADHQRRGVLQALDAIRPKRERQRFPRSEN